MFLRYGLAMAGMGVAIGLTAAGGLIAAPYQDRHAARVCELDARAQERRVARREEERPHSGLAERRSQLGERARLGAPTIQEGYRVAHGSDIGIGEEDRLAHARRAARTWPAT